MRGISLVVQWLKLQASNAEGTGSIPGQGTKIPHAKWHGQKIKIIIIKNTSEDLLYDTCCSKSSRALSYFSQRLISVSQSVGQFCHSVVSSFLRPHGLWHARFLCPSPTPGASSNTCLSSQWCHPTISSSVIPFSCLQSSPTSGSFPVSQFFASGGQSIGVSVSASVLPINIHDWFPLGWTGWISLQSKGLSRVFCNTTVQKYQFFGAQPSLWPNSHIHTWLLEKP